MSESGSDPLSLHETGNADSGEYSQTQVGTDDYTLTESDTLIPDGYSEIVTGTDNVNQSETGNSLAATYSRTIGGDGDYIRTETGGTLGDSTSSTSYSLTENANTRTGDFSQTETGTDRYGQLEEWTNAAQRNGVSTPGHLNYSPFGEAYVDDAAAASSLLRDVFNSLPDQTKTGFIEWYASASDADRTEFARRALSAGDSVTMAGLINHAIGGGFANDRQQQQDEAAQQQAKETVAMLEKQAQMKQWEEEVRSGHNDRVDAAKKLIEEGKAEDELRYRATIRFGSLIDSAGRSRSGDYTTAELDRYNEMLRRVKDPVNWGIDANLNPVALTDTAREEAKAWREAVRAAGEIGRMEPPEKLKLTLEKVSAQLPGAIGDSLKEMVSADNLKILGGVVSFVGISQFVPYWNVAVNTLIGEIGYAVLGTSVISVSHDLFVGFGLALDAKTGADVEKAAQLIKHGLEEAALAAAPGAVIKGGKAVANTGKKLTEALRTAKNNPAVTLPNGQIVSNLSEAEKVSLKVASAAGCFARGTPLLTPSGGKAIEDFKVGDAVLSADEHDPVCRVVVRYVEDVFERFGIVMTIHLGGRQISLTLDHPVFVLERGWVQAGELKSTDRLLGHDGEIISVDYVEMEDRPQTVYNLCVSEFHTFFVGDPTWGFSVWVHNRAACEVLQELIGLPAESLQRPILQKELQELARNAKPGSSDYRVLNEAFKSNGSAAKQLEAAGLKAEQFAEDAAAKYASGAAGPSAKTVHDKYVQTVRPGAKEKTFYPAGERQQGGLGNRRYDDFDPKTGTGYEGNTTPWNEVTHEKLQDKLAQVGSDIILLKDPNSGVKKVIWFGTEKLPKSGLGGQLRTALEKAGIEYRVIK